MALEDDAGEHFNKAFLIMQRIPETQSWKDMLEHVIETAMKMRRVKSVSIKED